MAKKLPRFPLQPIYLDEEGTARFRGNKIVRFLLDAGPFDMNKLALMEFSAEDRSHFAQLIGYSVCGFGDLSYADKKDVAAADAIVAKAFPVKKKPKKKGK